MFNTASTFEEKWQVLYHVYKKIFQKKNKCFYLWPTADNAYITDIFKGFQFSDKEQPMLTRKKIE